MDVTDRAPASRSAPSVTSSSPPVRSFYRWVHPPRHTPARTPTRRIVDPTQGPAAPVKHVGREELLDRLLEGLAPDDLRRATALGALDACLRVSGLDPLSHLADVDQEPHRVHVPQVKGSRTGWWGCRRCCWIIC